MKEKILNLPVYATKSEFIVVQRLNDKLWFYGAYGRDCTQAEKDAKKVDGIVCHNLRA